MPKLACEHTTHKMHCKADAREMRTTAPRPKPMRFCTRHCHTDIHLYWYLHTHVERMSIVAAVHDIVQQAVQYFAPHIETWNRGTVYVNAIAPPKP